VVLVPDFFKGDKAEGVWFTDPRYVLSFLFSLALPSGPGLQNGLAWLILSHSPENDAKKSAFMAKAMAFEPFLPALEGVVQAANGRFQKIGSWGGLGLCWGGKVLALSSGPGTLFSVTGQVHPGYVFSSLPPFVPLVSLFIGLLDTDM
jgi:hypothetical protein